MFFSVFLDIFFSKKSYMKTEIMNSIKTLINSQKCIMNYVLSVKHLTPDLLHNNDYNELIKTNEFQILFINSEINFLKQLENSVNNNMMNNNEFIKLLNNRYTLNSNIKLLQTLQKYSN
jgi:hypothetical protein